MITPLFLVKTPQYSEWTLFSIKEMYGPGPGLPLLLTTHKYVSGIFMLKLQKDRSTRTTDGRWPRFFCAQFSKLVKVVTRGKAKCSINRWLHLYFSLKLHNIQNEHFSVLRKCKNLEPDPGPGPGYHFY
jgi:hypothetical protein